MASVTCKLCNQQYAVIGCEECKTLVCSNCSCMCQGCGVPICNEHTDLTKGGRKLCGRCMSERKARRAALKDKYRTGERKSPSAPPSPSPPEGKLPSSPSSLAPFAGKGMSFAEIGGDGALIPVRETEEDIEQEAGLGQEHEDPVMRLDPEEAERNRKARETAQITATGRLELPPMDQNRPVLGQSGYQPPSQKKVFSAFLFFGIGMMYFYKSTPYFQDTLLPFDTTELLFNEGAMAVVHDTNRIRNTSNLQQLDIFSQAPMFFVSWLVVLSYCGGVLILVIGIIRSTYWSYIAKRNLEASGNLDKDANELQ